MSDLTKAIETTELQQTVLPEGRLTVAQVVTTINKMVVQQEQVQHSLEAIVQASDSSAIHGELTNVVKFAGALVANATRLLNANR